MNKTSLQVPSFTSEQRAEFARTYASGLDANRPVVACVVVASCYGYGASARFVEHAAVPAIHSMIENA